MKKFTPPLIKLQEPSETSLDTLDEPYLEDAQILGINETSTESDTNLDYDENAEGIVWRWAKVNIIREADKLKQLKLYEAIVENCLKEIERIKNIPENSAKSSFETTADYEKRTIAYRRMTQTELDKLNLAQKQIDLLKTMFEIGSISLLKIKLDAKNYDADKERWKISIIDSNEINSFNCEIKITPNAAKILWDNRDNIILNNLYSSKTPIGTFFLLDIPGKFDVPQIVIERIEIKERIYEKTEIEARFPGGSIRWNEYLQGKLKQSFLDISKRAPEGIYRVIILFVIDKEGKISDARSLTNHGYGMEEEAKRIIYESPKWIPAIQNGRKVNVYYKQQITFLIEEEEPVRKKQRN